MGSRESGPGHRASASGDAWRFAALAFALTMVLAYPLTIDPAGRVLADGPDTRLFMWTLAWDTHAFTHQPLSIFDANIYYPERQTLAYSENLIGSAVIAAPVLWLTGNPVLAMNVVALLSCVLCGVGAYVLGRRLGIGPASAALTGIIFAFSPPRFFRLSQLHLTTIQWIPFGLASLHAYLDDGRKSDLRLALAFFTLQALSSGHGAVFLALAMMGLVVYRAVSSRGAALRTGLTDAGVWGVLLLVPVLLLASPYRSVQVEMGLRRSPDDWMSNWASFLASPSHLHTLLLSLVPNARINETAQAYLFPGYLPLILAAVAFLRVRSDSRAPHANASRIPGVPSAGDARAFYGLLTVVSVWLSAGPLAGLWPLVYWLPGLSFIRVPSRFSLLALLGVAVLAGIGFERLSVSLTRRTRAILAAVAGALLVVEFAAVPLGTSPYHVQIPAVDRWLADQAKPFAVAELPMANRANLGAWERRHTEYMLHSMAHWQKTVEGYSGLRPPLHEELYSQLVNFPDERSLSNLAQLGVKYIVVHTDFYPPGQWPNVEARIRLFDDRLTLEREDGAGRVYQLRAPPNAASPEAAPQK